MKFWCFLITLYGINSGEITDCLCTVSSSIGSSQHGDISALHQELTAKINTLVNNTEVLQNALEDEISARQNLQVQYETQALHLKSLRQKVGHIEGKETVKQVGFSASLDQGYARLLTGDAVPFSIVHLNQGNHYNPDRYVYTCPLNGTYFFSVSLYSEALRSGSYKLTTGNLVMNNEKLAQVYCRNDDSGGNLYLQCSNSALTNCVQGSKVWVTTLWEGNQIYGSNARRHSNFNGFLISTGSESLYSCDYTDEVAAIEEELIDKIQALIDRTEILQHALIEEITARENLQKKHDAQTLQMETLKQKVGVIEAKESMQKVGFSASMNDGYVRLASSEAVPFRIVNLNQGTHYNPTTYVYTCPLNGTYYFSVSLYSEALRSGSYKLTTGTLVIDEEKMAQIYCRNDNSGGNIYLQCSNSVLTKCMKGNKVWVKSFWGDSQVYGGQSRRQSNFNGFLVYMD